MTQRTFKRYFSVKVLNRNGHKMEIEVTDLRNEDKSIYFWDGWSLVIVSGDLDMNYLDYCSSRGMGGGSDFVDIVEEYVMNELI